MQRAASTFAKSLYPDYFVREGNDMERSHAEFQDALSRVVGSATFRSSPRLAELLTHLVTQTVAGHADRLKGYAIALDVFGRDEDFDASSDSIVRVQMTRLRKALVEHYAGEGQDDPVRIVIQRGSYVPTLEDAPVRTYAPEPALVTAAPIPPTNEVPPGTETALTDAADRNGPAEPEAHAPPAMDTPPIEPRREDMIHSASALNLRRRAWVLLAVLALVSALLIVYWPGDERDTAIARAGEMPQGPTVFVVPFALSGASPEITQVRDGIQYDLVNYLSQLPNLAVIGLDENGVSPAVERRAKAAPRGSSFVLQGSVVAAGDKFRVNSSLVRIPGGVVVWSQNSDLLSYDPKHLLQLQSEIALGVASRLGQPYGVIHETMRQDLENHRDVSMEHYFCELRAFEFMRSKQPGTLGPVKECLERAVAANPNYSNGWALLSWVHTYQAVAEGTGSSQAALDAASRAVAANATNAQAYQFLAIARFHNGDFDAAREAIGKALEISPNNSEILADASRLLGVLGEHDIAPALAQKAIQLNPGHPAWYWSGLVIDALFREDGAQAVHYARLNAEDRGLIPRYLLASAYALDGQVQAAGKVLDQAAKDYPKVARDRRQLVRELHMPDFVTRPLEEHGLLGP
ncbi:TolB-like protein [Novosphingobium sp. PhB165]|uniref:tetratricopeptide repeat protein n=1 Tax=Novosphingobium sp. PhB165 TaxID=2485105 RepID=UPI0010ED81C1|nr:tetratricopeptide repeat protein [Novosphingobium sp. PhB165]TCM22271.1 TolB-like protein [Novosphingobium sp. PhB165]